MVVLNTQKAAADLLDRRAGIYSSRPRSIVSGEILCGGLNIAAQSYGPTCVVLTVFLFESFPDACYVRRWRRMRRAAHEGLAKSVVETFKRPQFNEAVLLASGLLAQPATMDKHLRRVAASMIMSVTYDVSPIVSEMDPGVKAINEFVARLAQAALPSSHFVEFFPWMRYIPSRWGGSCNNEPIFNSIPPTSRYAKWKRDAETWFERDSAMFESLFNGVREKQVCPFLGNLTLRLTLLQSKGMDRPSIAGTLIKDADRYGLSDQENAWVAAAL